MKTQSKQDIPDLCRTIGNLESHIINLNGSIQELKLAMEKMQRRLVAVEKQHWFLRGSLAAILFIGTLFGAAIDHIVKWAIGR